MHRKKTSLFPLNVCAASIRSEQQKGCCEVTDGKFEYTIYTSCCNGDKGIYYYTAYENHQITGVDMNKENLNSDKLICYPLIQGEQIKIQNQ